MRNFLRAKSAFLNLYTFSIDIQSNTPLLIQKSFLPFLLKRPKRKNFQLRIIFSGKVTSPITDWSNLDYILLPKIQESKGFLFALAWSNIFINQILPDIGAQTIHSAAIIINGKSDLFVGCSGYGKSTVSKALSPFFFILSDERVMLQIFKNKIIVVPYPLVNMENNFLGFSYKQPIFNHGVSPLNRVFLLKKSRRNKKKVISKLSAMKEILPNLSGSPAFREMWSKKILENYPFYLLEHNVDDLKGLLNELK